MKPIGILLAAGRGRRMGGNKQFHIVQTAEGEKPLVAAAFDTIAPVCETMIVVLGHRAEEVAVALGERKFETVSADPDAPMFDSIRAGLRAVNSREATLAGDAGDSPAILLQLGDHPSLAPATLDNILATAATHPDKAIMPTYQANGGHPVLVPLSIAQQILATPCPDGLRGFWSEHPELCVRFEVDDPSVICDIDTP
jgi:CTP:molybdopterin cytidylyltransferase MocA